MKKPSAQAKIRDLKSESVAKIVCLDKEARSLSERLAQAEIDLDKTREAFRKLADAAAEARQWQARFDQLLAVISKR